jgi:hypothetical protein
MIGGLWGWAVIALLVGFIPGILFFPWVASPLGPGLWKLSPIMSRIFLTLSQFIRDTESPQMGAGVLVKRSTNEYEIGTYLGNGLIQLSDRSIAVDTDRLRWGLFGKKPFGLTWEPGTDLHERIMPEDGEVIEDGDGGWPVNIGAAHRYLRGTNDADAITRTESKSKAKYAGGADALGDMTMAILIGAMLLLGSLTTFLMLG